MEINFNRLFGVLIIFSILLIIIPSSFALNETDVENSVNVADDNALQVSDDDLISSGSDYYFDSSNNQTGDGSQENPYSKLTPSRMPNWSTLHLANGNYDLSLGTAEKRLRNVTIIGEDAEKTIINCSSSNTGIFTVKNDEKIVLRNVTIIGFTFEVDCGYLIAKNTIFRDSVAPYEESEVSEIVNSALNSRGGAIHAYSNGYNYPKVALYNCRFINNTAEYGGAIFADDTLLLVYNSTFIDNYAYNYGGSIVCLHNCLVEINDTSVFNSKSLMDAGGAIYIYNSEFGSNNMSIVNCSATFGGAMACLNSTVVLSNLSAVNNSAKYDGGAIYQMYYDISITDSDFIKNSARNGGAIFVDDVNNFNMTYNIFEDNYASMITNSVYVMFPHSVINGNNRVIRNKTVCSEDVYEINKLNMVIGNGNYTLFYNNYTFDGVLPSRFSLVDYNYTSPIKDQQEGGNCWAFAAMASLESAILKASGPCLDLSEGNMKNLIQLFSDYGWNEETNEGGFADMAIAYLASWLGPVYESQDEYDDYNVLSPVIDSITHVQNIIFLTRDDYTDNDAIKRAIITYGGVTSGIYYDSDYYSESTYSYYYSGTPTSNHAISLVGWDDNFVISSAPGKGAWIAKNSWNTDWGDEGYFYVSYYDTSVARLDIYKPCYVFVFNDTVKYDKNYQYETIGVTDYYVSGMKNIWVENRYNSTDDELLAAVSTYFRKTTDYELFIYVNGELRHNSVGTCEPGYRTISLGGFIPLKKGDNFVVRFKITGKNAEFAIAENVSMNRISYAPGQSFLSKEGILWYDLYDFEEENIKDGHYYISQVACIKAFTILYEPNLNLQLTVSSDYNDAVITAAVCEDKYPIAYSGNVSFDVGGQKYTVELVNSRAVLPLTFDKVGVYDITASCNDLHANGTLKITKLNMHLDSSIIVGADNLVMKLSSPTVSNAQVKISLVCHDYPSDNKNYTVTLNKGKYDFYLNDLSYGDYTIYVNAVKGDYESHFDYNFKITSIKTRINASDIVSYHDFDGECTVRLTDSRGIPLPNCQVLFVIGSQSQIGKTNASGFASVNLKLDKVGKYEATVVFYGSGIYPEVTTKFTIDVKPTIQFLSCDYLVNSKYNIQLLDKNGTPLAKIDVSATVDGVNKKFVTDNNGKISSTINLKAGKHKITVYNSNTNEALTKSINVVNRIMLNKNMNVYYLSASYYKVRVYGDNGKPISGVYVKMVVNKKTYNVKSNSNGYASFKINLRPGNYKITATYKGYKVSNKIVVKPLLTTKNVSKKKSKITKFKAKLVNTKGKVVKGKKITFKIKGKRYFAKTNAKGIATLTLRNLKVGKYIVTTTCGKSTIKNKIVIKR